MLLELFAVLVVVPVVVGTSRVLEEAVTLKCPLQSLDSGIVVARLLAPLWVSTSSATSVGSGDLEIHSEVCLPDVQWRNRGNEDSSWRDWAGSRQDTRSK